MSVPIDCALGETCHIQQYTDADPGPGATDYTCGPLSYDGHKGTDFALPSMKMMEDGVDVRAAAPGTVRAMRDGVADRLYSDETAAAVEGRECGNGVVITHGDGWETQYCHLKQGSVAVREGQRVNATTVIGQVGLSGQTQFPHLHLSVRHMDAVVDPFAPDATAQCGRDDAGSLWSEPPAYEPGGLISAGFADTIPEFDAIKAGDAATDTLPTDAAALVVWGYVFGARPGDELALSITGPEGSVIEETVALDRQQAQLFRAVGRRQPEGGWAPGTYEGDVVMRRDGEELSRQSTTISIGG